MSPAKQFHLFSELGRNYKKQGEQNQALYYFDKALNQKDILPSKRLVILIKSCLLEYNASYFHEALELSPKDHPRLLELLKQHATHAFYHFDFSTAKETWSHLESLPFREAQIIGQAGQIILKDWGAVDSSLWTLLEANLLDSSFTWIVWYIEHNICCGQWVKALNTIHSIIPHIPEESYKYWHLLALEAWLQALLGKTTQAKQLLNQLEEKIPSPCMVEYARIAIVILRTQLYIGCPFSSFSISWEVFPNTIDELSTQRFLLQKSHKIPSRSRKRVECKTPLHWLRDIILCDQALSRVNSSQEECLDIWEQLQEKHHAIRLIIALHFARSSQTSAFIIFWTQRHEIELKICLQNCQSSQYNFHNWKN
jgi:tetratricopeptide (TPR) repeat protein